MTPENNPQRPTQHLDYEPIKKMDNEPEAPKEPGTTSKALGTVTGIAEKIQQIPAIAHLIRAAERFNDRMGNQLGAAITYFSFLSMIPILMVSFAAAGFVLASHPTLLQDIFNKILTNVSDQTLATTLKSTINTAVQQRTTVGIVGLLIALYSGVNWMGNLREAIRAQSRDVWERTPQDQEKIWVKYLRDFISLIGLLVAGWINRSIGRLSRYADAVTTDTPLPLPNPGSSELRKLAQALENMRIRLEGKNYIEHYVHALTHELKSPLAAIRGAAEILNEQPPPAVAARFIDNILVQNARMQSLVEKLLSQARLENRVEIEPVSVSISTLFSRLADSRSAVITAKNIILTCQPTSLQVQGDPELLEQALGNLLDNAIDFTPQGGTLQLAAEETPTELRLTVSDSGSGIPDYAMARIFERFYSLPRENGLKSSGLGLAFVQEVARLHQGDIALHNQPEGGVKATLTLHRHFT